MPKAEYDKSPRTKKLLANAIMELAETMPVSRIKITDICEKAELNRLSFYYHFKDKYDYLYFDLSVGGTRFWERKGLKIDKEYKSSLEIIKALEKFVKNDRAKFVVIDYWQLVEDKNDWFLRKLMEFTWEYKLIIFITSQLVRNVEKRI